MGWIRHLPSIVASSLLFGFIGLPLGTAAFFTILHLTADRPTSYRGFVDFLIGPGFVIAVIAGAVPAFATGVIAGILRIYIRALWLLAGVMAPVGAAMTAVYTELLNSLFGWHGVPKQGEIILTGGIAASVHISAVAQPALVDHTPLDPHLGATEANVDREVA